MIYKRDTYIIFSVANGFIVYNQNKKFEEGHTHLKSFNACKTLIDLAIKKKIPRSNSFYYLRSLIRIVDDIEFKSKIEELVRIKKSKGKQNYKNK